MLKIQKHSKVRAEDPGGWKSFAIDKAIKKGKKSRWQVKEKGKENW